MSASLELSSPAAGITNKTNHYVLISFSGWRRRLGQQKKQRQLQATIAELKAGDKVITTGGVIGTITAVRDTSFFIRSADKTILEIARSAVAGVDSEEEKT
jgi:preprotein translocase YajC subunit